MTEITMACPEDYETIRRIYSQYIDTPITFEYELPDEITFRKRLEGFAETYPVLVAKDSGGHIIGYTYAHRIFDRKAYYPSCELTVYIDRHNTSSGVGKRLCSALLDILDEQGVRNVYSLVTIPNPASEGLHRSLGFSLIATLTDTGYKNGSLRNVGWFEKKLSCTAEPGAGIKKCRDLPRTRIDEILSSYSCC